MFCESFVIFSKSKGMNVQCSVIDIPQPKSDRPELSKILDLLEEAFGKDVPVAFLNLCNGDENELESWHWGTIVSLNISEDGRFTFIDILDGGVIKIIDLVLWYNTTKLGGGFMYFN